MKKTYKIYAAVSGAVLLLILILLVVISVRQKSSFAALLEETRRNAEHITLIDRTVQRIGDDANEVRSLLFLDPVHYSTTPTITENQEQGDRFELFIKALESFDAHYARIAHIRELSDFMIDAKNMLSSLGLVPVIEDASFSLSETSGRESETDPLFSGGWDGTDMTIDSRITKNRYRGPMLVEEVRSFLSEEMRTAGRLRREYEQFKTAVAAWLDRPDIQTLLDELKIVVELVKNGSYEKRLLVRSSDYREIGSLVDHGADGKVEFADRSWDALNAFFGDFPGLIRQMDTRSFGVLKTEEMIQALVSTFSDDEFLSVLDAYSLKVALKPREDADFFYFDLTKDGMPYGSFGVLKELGELYLLDSDDVPIRSLEALNAATLFPDENRDEKKKDFAGSDDMTAVLLCGSHESNPDTMILYVSNPGTKEAFLFSIPRDLYYKGQKINYIYQHFGPEQFLKDISAITGVSVRSYINVDMYAFIDIINIIGGIEVTLNEPLIDPTYRIKENGLWKTLHYDKGTHRLDGFGALRIARSRHTSSDFDRAERQQLIIASLMEKFGETAQNDISTMYKLVQTGLRYVSTNISPLGAIRLAGEVKDMNVKGKYVLSTGNVLYHTTSPSGLWILLPKGDNWGTIASFIKSKLQFSM
ncbi:MAG: LCP family protein [Spirochaetales bacterium]|nr:LCP family protein [Spirochaetales bacterium]